MPPERKQVSGVNGGSPLLAGLAICAVIAGCAGAPSATPTLAPTATPVVTAPPPTPTPVASPTIPRLSAGNREPGTYRTYQANPQVLLTLGEGWGVYFDEPDGTYMNLGKAELLVGKSSDVIDPETHERVPNPPDVMAWLVAHPGLNATDPTPVLISGHDASYVDVEPTTTVDVFYDPLGNFHVGPENVARFYVIPWDGPDMFIAILRSPSGTFEEALEVGVPVAESVAIVE